MTTEIERQRALLAALWSGAGELPAGLGPASPARRVGAVRGMQAYRANAGATAERALAATCPVVKALVGDAAFAGLARACWRARPPARGDLAWAGEALADFIAGDPQLRDLPYLADVARLEWCVARADGAADLPGTTQERLQTLQRLGEADPAALRLALAPGAAVLVSDHPVASIWRAHLAQAGEVDLEQARQAMDRGEGETVFVWRPEWRPRVETVGPATAAFLGAVIDGRDLAIALEAAWAVDPDWSFEAWLGHAIAAGWLAGVGSWR